MDQFPFGKGKTLFPLLLPALFCLLAQTWVLLLRTENVPPLIVSLPPFTLFFHASCDYFPEHC